MKEIKKVKTAVIILLIFSFLNMVSKSVKIIAVGIEKAITYKVLKEKRLNIYYSNFYFSSLESLLLNKCVRTLSSISL